MPFTYYRTVRFQDTDAAGVVFFSNTLSICHEAYEASLEVAEVNLREFFGGMSIVFPIVCAHADFFRPMYCGDHLVVKMMPQQLGQDKFETNYEILVDDVLVSKALTRHVCIEFATRSKQPLPDFMVEWLETYRRDTEK